MNKIEIPDRSFIKEIASSWEELSKEQISSLLKLADKSSLGILTATRFKVEAFYIIADIRRNWISIVKESRLSKKRRLEKYCAIYQIADELTGFLFTDPRAEKLEISYNSIFNNFPFIKSRRCKLYGPDDMLINLTFGEFRAAYSAMGEYFSSRTTESLNEFIACLYRPAELTSVRPRREAFDSSLVPVYADQVKDVPRYIKTGILLWFTSCIKYFQNQDLLINGKTVNLSPLFPHAKPGEKANGGLGWTGIHFSIAKDQVFGDVDKTDTRNLYDILLYMYDNHLSNERIKALSNKK